MFILKAERRIPKKVNGEWTLTYRIETVATTPIITREFRRLALEQETDSRRVWIEEV
jgi:hypothetical protein